MEREGYQAFRGLERAEGPEAAVVHPPPGAFELLSGRLPLMELPLPNLTPAFQARHNGSSPYGSTCFTLCTVL